MQRFKFIRFIGLLICFFLINIEESYAFFSPSTLQLLTASIGPWIQYIMVIILSVIVSFMIKINKEVKKFIYLLPVIALILISIFILKDYNTISDMNKGILGDNKMLLHMGENVANICCNSFGCNLDACGNLLEVNGSSYSEFMNQRYIDLNEMDMEEYYTFKIISIHPDSNIKLLGEGSIAINSTLGIKKGTKRSRNLFNYSNMQNFLTNFDKDEKLLFYCYGGGYSVLLGFVAYNLGYDAYYTSLQELHNDKIINSSIVQKERDINSILILPYNPKKQSKRDKIFIKFSEVHSHLLNILEERLAPIETYFYYLTGNLPHYKINDDKLITEKNLLRVKEQLLNKDILCYSDLNCLLTQHFLYSINISGNIVEIYKMSSQEIWAPTGYLLEEPLK